MPAFCRLRDEDSYRACDWDLMPDPAAREAWIRTFETHTTSLLNHARASYTPPTEEAICAYESAYLAALDQFRQKPADFVPFTIYHLCQHRAQMMREFGMGDPYDRVKRVENEAALRHLPRVLAALDARGPDGIVETLVRGVLAGNKFDLGARDTLEQHAREGIDFFKTLDGLGRRPWFADQVDEIERRLAGKEGKGEGEGRRMKRGSNGTCPYRKAMFFVDNAGGDVVLGAIPLARHLARQGCKVVLAANDYPALNDVLVDELNELLVRAADCDTLLAQQLKVGQITTVGTGCDCPLIDLSMVSEECNAAAADCDLVILEGMGRAVETNYSARFDCDVIHLAMIKNRALAAHLGCDLYDLVARFTAA